MTTQENPKPSIAPAKEEIRARYISLVKESGIDHALTEIHNEIGRLEPRVFDGGYQHERFLHVQSLRLLAQELWNIKLREQTTKAYGEEESQKTFGKNFAKIG
jgi:hypothetical protein